MMVAPTGGPLTGVASIDAILRIAHHLPVFPCLAREKEVLINGKPKLIRAKSPHIPNGFLKASQDESQIRAWWKRWPDALVGVPMGQTTGLIAVDYDPGKHTEATGEWIQTHADALMSARIHGTLRNGRHYLYRIPAGQRYRTGSDLFLAGKIRNGIDLRAEGGYIIWWPLHGGNVTNEQAPFLPAGLIEERSFATTDEAPRPRQEPSPEAWNKDRHLVADALAYLDPAARDVWLRVGLALHLATGGNDDGFEMWHAWSAGEITGDIPHTYCGLDDCRYNWASFNKSNGSKERITTLGSLFHEAKQHGYAMPKAQHNVPPPPTEEWAPSDEPQPPKAEESRIEARVFAWVEPKSIPPRPWLFGRHYMRGMVSATAGVGGAGKSTLLNVELVSMAIGRDLLNGGAEIPVGPMNVWGHNGEDPYEELQRRIMAVCQHYGVTLEDLGGRLRITSGRDMPIMVARELSEGGKILIPTADGKEIAAEIVKHGIQVFVADPLITIHRVNENDNVQIDGVMTILRDLAHNTQSALEVAHHFRKLNGDDANVDAIRGAGSLVGACRSVRIVAGMSRDESTKYGIDDEQRGFYSWLQNGKANMLPPTHRRRWMFMASTNLCNGAGPYGDDEIGVVTQWVAPDADSTLTPVEFRSIRRVFKESNPLNCLRADPRAEGWAGVVMAKALELESSDKVVRAQMQQIINRFCASGYLKREALSNPKKGRAVPVLVWHDGASEE
jgi:hypothetical protein